MAAAGITALLKKMDYKDVVVAIDGKHCLIIESFYIYILSFSFITGSVFRYHPHFPNIMRSRISQLVIIHATILLR